MDTEIEIYEEGICVFSGFDGMEPRAEGIKVKAAGVGGHVNIASIADDGNDFISQFWGKSGVEEGRDLGIFFIWGSHGFFRDRYGGICVFYRTGYYGLGIWERRIF